MIPKGRGEGRVALVTGGSRGIGRATVLRLAREGYVVAVSDLPRQREALEGVREDAARDGGEVVTLYGDVSEPGDVATMVEHVASLRGRIDVLVNNAGVLSVHRVEDTEPDEWDRMFKVNAKGTFLVSKALLPHLRARRYGRIVNVASIGGKRGGPGQAHYCASKGAVITFTNALAQEVGSDGITVNAVCPGIIDTDMGRNNYRDGKALEQVIAKTTLARLGEPDDVVGAIAFFASDDAAFITGQTLNVCGGIVFS